MPERNVVEFTVQEIVSMQFGRPVTLESPIASIGYDPERWLVVLLQLRSLFGIDFVDRRPVGVVNLGGLVDYVINR